MFNKAPIFINGFTRGGSNILVNLLLSHPRVCFPTGELGKVFRGRARIEPWWRTIEKRVAYDWPLSIAVGQSLFSTDDLRPRPALPSWMHRYIDRVLYREKLRARHERHNLYKAQGVPYTAEEVVHARLLCKNLNGLVLLTPILAEMYPDATFFGLVRNGLALCEGHIRRGMKAEEFARRFNRLARAMIEDSRTMPHYHVVRFENMIADPIATMKSLYRDAGLDFAELSQVRLQIKAVVTREGDHHPVGGADRQVVWYDRDAVPSHFTSDIDAVQIARLAPRDRDAFMRIAGETMAALGYV